MVVLITTPTERLKNNKNSHVSPCICDADLTLLPFLGKDVTNQSLLKNFLLDQKMP